MVDINRDFLAGIGLVSEVDDRERGHEKQADFASRAKQVAVYAGLPLVGGALGAEAGRRVAGRKRFTVGAVDTSRGRSHVVGERRYIKRLAKGVADKDPKTVIEAGRHLLFLPGGQKRAEVQPPQQKEAKYEPDENVRKAMEVARVIESDPGVRKAQGRYLKRMGIAIPTGAAAGTALAGLHMLARGKPDSGVLKRLLIGAGLGAGAGAGVGTGMGIADLGKAQRVAWKGHQGKQKAAAGPWSPKAFKALAGVAALGGGALGAAGTWAGLAGRDFAVVDTPLGAIGGRRSDVKGVVEAAKEKDREEFKRHLKRVVPLHPVVTRAIRMKQSSALMAGMPDVFKEAGVLTGIRKWFGRRFGSRMAGKTTKKVTGDWGGRAVGKGVKGGLPPTAVTPRTPFPRAGELSDIMGASAKQKQVKQMMARRAPGAAPQTGGRVAPIGAPRPKPQAAVPGGAKAPTAGGKTTAVQTPKTPPAARTGAAGPRKPLMSLGTKAMLGGVGVLGAGTYLGGKLISEAGGGLRAAMQQPGTSYMARQRFG